jgi:hypothetical protein
LGFCYQENTRGRICACHEVVSIEKIVAFLLVIYWALYLPHDTVSPIFLSFLLLNSNIHIIKSDSHENNPNNGSNIITDIDPNNISNKYIDKNNSKNP